MSSRPAPRSILVVCMRRIGDVLLTTPLVRSLRAAWPAARIELLVLPGTDGVVRGNPDLDAVHVWPRGQSGAQLRAGLALFRRYDLALAATGSDRARFLARWAGRRCMGLWSSDDPARGRHWLPGTWVPYDELGDHAVLSPLRLAQALGIAPVAQVVAPGTAGPAPAGSSTRPPGVSGRYAVLHPWPKFVYKAWPATHWQALARAVADLGLQIVVTGGPEPAEVAAAEALAGSVPGARCLAGQLGFAALAQVLRGASVYVGPDTAVTHLAAATGIPVIALFGPSLTPRWAPWPAERRDLSSPWALRGSSRQGNVWLVQGEAPCVPCTFEGCDRHLQSRSRCLDTLPVTRVLQAVHAALDLPAPVDQITAQLTAAQQTTAQKITPQA